jgi:hypothetical protein
MSFLDSPTDARRSSRDTGFPEPLDGTRNTTLPHPDADLSPTACISQEENMSMERVFKRSRRGFRGRNKRTVSHGFLSPHTEAIQTALSLSLMNTAFMEQHEDAIIDDTPKAGSPTTVSSARFSKDGQSSAASFKDKSDYTPPSSPEPSEPSRRKSLFHKLRRR